MAGPLLEVVRGDIARQDVDAIVNAANRRMRGGGGVDGAIHAAAGPGLLAECIERFPHGLETGQAGLTTGHDLAARWVVHVVGPVYDGHGGNRDLLVSCYRNALAVADALVQEHRLAAFTIAFPLVSAGAYGWPRPDAARVAVQTLRRTPSLVAGIRLVAFDAGSEALVREALAA